LISTLSYYHSLIIIHPDIKPDNIMIADYNQIKLIDFGIIKEIESKKQNVQTQIGTYI
jgi:serine/threonine protein kinase